MTLFQRIALRYATGVLVLAGFRPYFDIRASASTKDVIGARVGKRFNAIDELEGAARTATMKPGERLTLRMYVDLSKRVLSNDGVLVPPGGITITPGPGLAPDTGLAVAPSRVVAGAMGNVRAHNGMPAITMPGVAPQGTAHPVCDSKGQPRQAEWPDGPFLPTCSICGEFSDAKTP